MRPLFSCTILVLATILAGCSYSGRPGMGARKANTNTAMSVERGEVISVIAVTLPGDASAVGRYGGGYVGHESGRTVGDGSGSKVAGAVGGVVGWVAGEAIEEKIRETPGQELTIVLDNGREIAVVQVADPGFDVGERVRVLMRPNGYARVTKL